MKINKIILSVLTFLAFIPKQANSLEYLNSLKKRLPNFVQKNQNMIALSAAVCAGAYLVYRKYNQVESKKDKNTSDNFKKSLDSIVGNQGKPEQEKPEIVPLSKLIIPSAHGLGLIPKRIKEQPIRAEKGKPREKKMETLDPQAERKYIFDQSELKQKASENVSSNKKDKLEKEEIEKSYIKEMDSDSGDYFKLQMLLDEANIFLNGEYNSNNLQKILDIYLGLLFYHKRLQIGKLNRNVKDLRIEKIDKLADRPNGKIFEEDFNKGPWIRGQKIVKEILSETYLGRIKSEEDYLTDIKDVVWYLYALAVQKNEPFVEGTFHIEDPKGLLLNFLTNYKGTYDRSGPGQCSHYHEINEKKYGLDVPKEMRDKIYFPPFNKEKNEYKFHILFGKYKKGYIFLKPETYGTNTLNDKFYHGIEFGSATINKFKVGADDQANMKKERVPSDIQKLWEELVYSAHKTNKPNFVTGYFTTLPKKLSDDLKAGKDNGIGKMLEIIRNNENYIRNNRELYESFMKKVTEFDHVESRKGREVILNKINLVGGLILN